MLPHTLELVDNPRQLLAEACRIIKPEGLIVICGFNPYSPWGLRKVMNKHKTTPWNGNFISAAKVKSWLHLADFELEKHRGIIFRPPVNQQRSIRNCIFSKNRSRMFFRLVRICIGSTCKSYSIDTNTVKMETTIEWYSNFNNNTRPYC